MKRALLVVLLVPACGVSTGYAPRHVARGELTLGYNTGMQIFAGREQLTEGPQYAGLEQYVRCVPIAADHARLARSNGRAGVGLAWTGGTLGVVSLGGLAGLAFLDDPGVAWALLGTGIGTAALGIVFAATSRTLRNHAHGHAIDALNYYNDTVGSRGGTCDDPPLPPPVQLRPPPAAPLPPAGPQPRPTEPTLKPMDLPTPPPQPPT